MHDFDVQRDISREWQLLEEAGFAACILDRQLRYRRANAAWRAYLEGDTLHYGQQQASWRRRAILDDVPDHHRARWSRALGAIVDGRLGYFVDRATEAQALGERLVVTTASPAVGDDGQIDGVLCIRFDVTDAQQATANEERLVRVLLTARRLQHYLGNQLALTLGYVELLTLDPRLPAELRERVDEALRGVLEATETLSQLRLVTRLELHHDDPVLTDRLGPTDPP